MKLLTLTQNQYAIVDDEAFLELNCFKWCVQYNKNTPYACRTRLKSEQGHKTTIYLHKEVFKFYNGAAATEIDHINNDSLDNRIENLRKCTRVENCFNKTKQRNNTSGYKGVHQRKNKWEENIQYNKKFKYLGLYLTAEDAARAYDKAAQEFHGEFANLNFSKGS